MFLHTITSVLCTLFLVFYAHYFTKNGDNFEIVDFILIIGQIEVLLNQKEVYRAVAAFLKVVRLRQQSSADDGRAFVDETRPDEVIMAHVFVLHKVQSLGMLILFFFAT